jgi:hypothetical protein
VRQARRALGGGAGTAISSFCAAFHVPFAHFPNWHFAQRFAGAAMACTRSNGSHAALITPGMRVQKLDELLGGGLSIKSQPSP